MTLGKFIIEDKTRSNVNSDDVTGKNETTSSMCQLEALQVGTWSVEKTVVSLLDHILNIHPYGAQ